MPWKQLTKLSDLLKTYNLHSEPKNCFDCGVEPGQPHRPGCDIERCSHCGGQMLMCGSDEHDPLFARWTGFWPGELEAVGLGMISTDGGPYVGADLNGFMEKGLHKIFFVKPKA